MRVTIKDIAQYAGVSISTVSVVMSGKGEESRISKETADKVRDACVKLNYRPNLLASSLRKGFTKTIGIVVSDISNPFFTILSSVIEREVAKFGYSVFVAGSDEKDEKCCQIIDDFVNFQVDGLILAVTGGVKKRILELERQNIPFVLLDRYFSGIKANTVLMDNYLSAYNAVNYLLQKGRKRIATFAYETNLKHMEDRFNGYRAALKNHGIRYDKRLTPSIPFLDIDNTFVKEKIKDIVENQHADAIFFQTNRTALPGIQAIKELGYDVPSKLSIICFHENAFFKLLNPTITAQCQPIEEMAVECANLLLSSIKGDLDGHVVKKILPAKEIIEREST